MERAILESLNYRLTSPVSHIETLGSPSFKPTEYGIKVHLDNLETSDEYIRFTLRATFSFIQNQIDSLKESSARFYGILENTQGLHSCFVLSHINDMKFTECIPNADSNIALKSLEQLHGFLNISIELPEESSSLSSGFFARIVLNDHISNSESIPQY